MPRPKKESSGATPTRKRNPRKTSTPAAAEPTAAGSSSVEASAPTPTPAPKPEPISPAERHRMIAEAAYYLALKKGPQSDPHQNWLEAEAQIDARLRSEGRL